MTTKKVRTRSEIGKANLAKSKAAELAAVRYLRVSGWPGAERTVRTGYRSSARTSPDLGDIDGTPGVAWQVKAYASEGQPGQILDWLTETEAQRVAARADVGVLVVKRTGHAHAERWWAYLRLDALAALLGGGTACEVRAPIRLELADVASVLRAAGYGSPLAAQDAQEAS